MTYFNLRALRPSFFQAEPDSFEFSRAQILGEEELVALWADVLELAHVGIDDDFFTLGGDSLMALELMVKLERLSGKKLPLSMLMEAKTVRQFAKALASTRSSPIWPSLVPIQPGTERPPLFCVHPIGGNILGYFALARHLGPDQPVYALRARGLDGVQEPHDSIEAMARDYIDEIRRIQPEGPYFICGHSFGGLVAFEMAQQLHAHGQQTALLAVFDSRRLLPSFSRFVYGGLLLTTLQFGTLARKAWCRLKWRIGRLRIKAVQLYCNLARRPLPRDVAHSRVWDYCCQAARRYALRVYPGRLTLFRAATPPISKVHAKARINWDEMAAGGVETLVISSGHEKMLDEPQVQVLARELRECLEKAQYPSSAPQVLAV